MIIFSTSGVAAALFLRSRTFVFAALVGLCVACGSGGAAPAAGANLPAFDAARAWKHLERVVAFGSRTSGSASLERLRVYLDTELTSYGLTPRREVFTDRTPVGDVVFQNVIVDIPGAAGEAGDPAPIFVLAGHIDTKRLPFEFVGANDAGSSTAVLLELARVLASQTGKRPVTYRLAFFDGEEAVRPYWAGVDNTYGSRHHVAELQRRGELEHVRACVLIDMVGDKDLVLTTELNSDRELLALFFEAARDIGLGAHVGGSARELYDDHLPFRAVGIRSVDLIDFDYGGPDNPFWHKAEDTLDKCSQKSLGVIGRIVLAGLPRLETLLGP